MDSNASLNGIPGRPHGSKQEIAVCRGFKCDKREACEAAGKCLYRPSADEARDVMRQKAADAKTTSFGGYKVPIGPVAHKCWYNYELGTGCSCARIPETIAVTQIVRNIPVGALPADSSARKDIPLASGMLDYFPAALAAVAELSRIGNEKHNPGEPLHWSRSKSSDHADCIMRHLADRGKTDTDGLSHTVKVAWRALALLQEELEAQGAPLARGAKVKVEVSNG